MHKLRRKICAIIIASIAFCICINVKANVICNDGTESKSCVDCHQGCCRGHDGCSNTNESDYYNPETNITCNDGSISRTCTDCHQGCCSGHGGCIKYAQEEESDDDFMKYVTYGIGASGIAGAAYAGSKYLSGKKR